MPKQLASLKMRIRMPDGSRPYVLPAKTKNNKLKAKYALVDNAEQYHPEGIYTVCWRRDGLPAYEAIGSDPSEAEARLARKRLELAGEAQNMVMVPKGQLPPLPAHSQESVPYPIPATSKVNGRSLKECVATYIKETQDHKTKKTFDAYRNNLDNFRDFYLAAHIEKATMHLTKEAKPALTRQEKAALAKCAVMAYEQTCIEDITREHLLAYALFLRLHRKNIPRSVRNKIDFFHIFLHHYCLPSLLLGKDLPKFTKKKVRKYNKVQLQKMFAEATLDEWDLMHFLLGIGPRAQEASYACYPDVDYITGEYTITEHLELGFTPKDGEEGTFPIPRSLVEILLARRKRYPDTRIIFSGPGGKPDLHLLRRIKRLGLRAGVNCGFCVSKSGLSCATEPVCKQVILHTMRKTYASMLHKNGISARTIMRYLRHSDLETTLAYLADDEDDDETRATVDGTFGVFAVRPHA
jgi:integrase/recombinase XerD